jgi:hypothetical protein
MRKERITKNRAASLGEYLVLNLSADFAMTETEAVHFLTKALEGSPNANVDCQAAIRSCFDKGWLTLSDGKLVLAGDGKEIVDQARTGETAHD